MTASSNSIATPSLASVQPTALLGTSLEMNSLLGKDGSWNKTFVVSNLMSFGHNIEDSCMIDHAVSIIDRRLESLAAISN